MTSRLPRVYNLAPGGHFLDDLAEAVLSGFPVEDTKRPLSDWTILLPTRRAARAFADVLRAKKHTRALILPRIKPIGDLDEDRLAYEMVSADLPPAISSVAQLFVLLGLVKEWLAKNQHLAFAQEIASSPLQSIRLAESLDELLQRVETQECGFEKLHEVYGAEHSEHREAILSLLSLLSLRLPEIHAAQGTIGATARRSLMIRQEAARIAQGGHQGPIIAAGSTGTIPATRVLLEAIARHEQGAVVLPGLDGRADDDSWAALPPEHPQFALKELLEAMGLKRGDVKSLGMGEGRRPVLTSELMRPSATAEKWHETLPRLGEAIKAETTGLTEIAAPDRHIEARAIALVLRESLDIKNQTAALVTPDRDLAARVASELRRYNIVIEDSGGTSLSRLGAGSLLDLLCAACTEGSTAKRLMAILRHADVTHGWDRPALERALRQLEVACLRGLPFDLAELTFVDLVTISQKTRAADSRAHHVVKSITLEDWENLIRLAASLDKIFDPLRRAPIQAFAAQLAILRNGLEALAPGVEWQRPVNVALADLLYEVQKQASLQPEAPLKDVALLVQQILRRTTGPPPGTSHRRLAILGTLEARRLPADVMILGGLNETVWPAQADSGPWLNRTMRSKMGLPPPEREIGLAAHDFAQGLGHAKTFLTWSGRLGGAPAGPSRWLLRLDAVLKTVSLKSLEAKGAAYVAWAKALHRPDDSLTIKGPISKPKPKPRVALRPTRFSATEVERLVRNPYAIFARRILQLEPLPDFGFAPDAAMRGSLFHDAIKLWNEQQAPDAECLIESGRKVFAPLIEQHEIRTFWWPQYLRMANWLAKQEAEFKPGLLRIHAEVSGKHEFKIQGVPHKLTARADRIDALQNAVRIIDYKTGSLPSPDQIETGLSPQLPLEAAILLNDGFPNIYKGAAVEALYMRISASMKGLEKKLPTKKGGPSLVELAEKHLAGLKALLEIYHSETQAYLPRVRVFKDEDEADFDHLSRFLEWQLAGES
jgi:ATP-dependent helicase/nuclease subunit B